MRKTSKKEIKFFDAANKAGGCPHGDCVGHTCRLFNDNQIEHYQKLLHRITGRKYLNPCNTDNLKILSNHILKQEKIKQILN